MAAAGLKDARVWRVDRRADTALRHVSEASQDRLEPRRTISRARSLREHAVEVDRYLHRSARQLIRFATTSSRPWRLARTADFWRPVRLNFSAKIWEVATGRLRQTLSCPERVYAVAFSPDGKTLATGSRDGSIQLSRTCAVGRTAASAWTSRCFCRPATSRASSVWSGT